MAFVFCPGHVLGRVGMLHFHITRMRALFETIIVGGQQEEFCDEDEAGPLLCLARMGLVECEEAGKEIENLRNMALAHNEKSVRAAAGKEG